MFGVFVYAFQGQFTLPLAYQGMSKFAWQTVGNVISLITGIIAAGLYGNIGISTSPSPSSGGSRTIVTYLSTQRSHITTSWSNGSRDPR